MKIFIPLFTLIRIIASVVMLTTAVVSAQPVNNHIGTVAEPAPNAASLGQYGDVPVSYATGILNVTVPIHTITAGPLAVPVFLSYHSGGVRVAEMASRVGMGWTVQGGGIISRTIQGIEDEAGLGYLAINQDMYTELEQDETGVTRECYRIDHPSIDQSNTLLALKNGQVDGEPDIFSFSIPGYNGKFHFDARDSVVQIPKSDLKIYYELDDYNSSSAFRLRSFTVVDTEGNRYIFGTDIDGNRAIEVSSTNRQFDVASSWYLQRILSADGEYSINYTYRTQIFGYKSLSFNFGTFTQVQVRGYEIDEIISATGTVKFVPGQPRQDLHQKFGGPDNIVYSVSGEVTRELSEIDVNLGEDISSIKYVLQQEYFVDSEHPVAGPENLCLMLKSVQKVSSDDPSINEPPYTFEYFSESPLGEDFSSNYLPNRLSYAIDHWGYYNGAHDNSNKDYNIPKTTIRHFRPSDGGFSLAYSTKGESFRDTRPAYMKLGSLEKMTYPTGGTTEFVFEANDYYKEEDELQFNEISAVVNSGQCLFKHYVGQTSVEADDIQSLFYTFTSNPLPGTWCSTPFGGAYVEIWEDGVRLNGSILGYSEDFNALGDEIDLQEGSTYTFKVYENYASAEFRLFRSETVTNNRNQSAGGLRIKSLTTNTGDIDDVSSTKQYSYLSSIFPGRSSGRIFREPNYGNRVEYVFSDACTPSLQNNSDGNDVNNGTTNHSYGWSSYPTAPLSSFEGRTVTYANVVETLPGDGGSMQYQFVQENIQAIQPYSGGGTDNKGFPWAPVPAAINEGNLSGKATLDTDGGVVASEIHEVYPESYEYSEGTYIKVASYNMGSSVNEIFHRLYRIRSKAYRLESVTSIVDGVSRVKNLEYASLKHLAPTATWTIGSNGDRIREEISYTKDAVDPTSRFLSDRNILKPISVIKKVNGIPVDGTKTIHKNLDGYVRPWKIMRFESTQNHNGLWTGLWIEQATIKSYQHGRPHLVNMPGWQDELYTWSSSGLLLEKKFIDFIQKYEYYGGTNLLKKFTAVDGAYSLYVYDDLGRLKTATPYSHEGNSESSTYYEYKYAAIDAQTQRNYVKTTTRFQINSQVRPLTELQDQITYQYLDGLGRPMQTVRQQTLIGGGSSETYVDQVLEAVLYDEIGRPFKKYEPFASTFSDGRYVKPSASHDHTLHTFYADPLSRVHTVVPPSWDATTYSYGTNLEDISGVIEFDSGTLFKTVVKDADGLVSESFKDLRGRAVISRKLSPLEENTSQTCNAYDYKDRLVTIYPPEATESTYELLYRYTYTRDDKLSTKKVPDSKKETYYYNERDLLTNVERGGFPSGYEYLSTAYDDYGRPLASGFRSAVAIISDPRPSDFPAGTMLSRTVYGTAENPFYANKPIKQESWVMDEELPSGKVLTTVPTYDEFGRVTETNGSSILKKGPTIETYKFVFSPTGTPVKTTHKTISANAVNISIATTLQDAAGRVIADKHKLIENQRVGENVTVAEYQYTAKDQISAKHLGGTGYMNLQTVNYHYHANGFLRSINEPDAPEIDLFALELSYLDNPNNPNSSMSNGNITAATTYTKGTPAFTQWYAYDDLNRLKSVGCQIPVNGAVKNFSSDYTYDKRGNLKTLNRYGRQTNGNYGIIDELTYDTPGNTNKLLRVTENNTSDKFRAGYDAQGSGIAYRYDDNGNVEYDPSKDMDILYNYLNLPYRFTLKNGLVVDITYGSTGQKLAETTTRPDGSVSVRQYLGDMEFVDGELAFAHHAQGRVLAQALFTGTPPAGCGNTNVPDVPDYPGPEEPGMREEENLGKYDGFLPKDRTMYEGGETSTTADIPKTNAIAFTGQRVVKLEPGFKSPEGTKMMATTQQCTQQVIWQYEYYLKDHLGNTRVRFADLDLDGSISEDEVLGEHHYYAFGMEMQGEWNTPTQQGQSGDGEKNRYRYNGMELNEDLGLYNYGARWYDPAIGRWNAVDPLASEYAPLSPYVYVANTPINAIDPDGKRIFFVGGAGNDSDGWNYINRWGNYITQGGIGGFQRINASFGKAMDIAVTNLYRDSPWAYTDIPSTTKHDEWDRIKHRRGSDGIFKAQSDIEKNLAANPLEEGEQLNLAGYSYGSVAQAHVALRLADKGTFIDNLILIGSPISDNSSLYESLKDHENIGNVLRVDIEGDLLSNPQDILEFLGGASQNSGDDGPHFDLARPGGEANRAIQVVVEWLRQQGVE